MSFRATTLIAAAAFIATPAVACEMHEAKASMSSPEIDLIKTASMAMAAPVTVGDLAIEGYWVKAMLPGQPVAAGFLKLTNKGGTDDTLVSVKTAKSGRVELHEMAMKGDVMQMRALEGGIKIPAGSTVALEPGGLHVMFFDIVDAFKDGDTVLVTLTFEKAGTVELMVPVMAKAMMDH
jgi:copper(I)-binding protein